MCKCDSCKIMDEARKLNEPCCCMWYMNNVVCGDKSIKDCNDKTGYIIDPHGAIGWAAWDSIRSGAMNDLVHGIKNDYNKPGLTPNIPCWAQKVIDKKAVGVILETASPAKFGSIVTEAIGKEPPMPSRLEEVMRLPDRAIPMENDYNKFKDWLFDNL